MVLWGRTKSPTALAFRVLRITYFLNLILIEKAAWFHLRMNDSLLSYIHMEFHRCCCCWGNVSCIIFNDAHELYQRLIDQLDGIRWRTDWEYISEGNGVLCLTHIAGISCVTAHSARLQVDKAACLEGVVNRANHWFHHIHNFHSFIYTLHLSKVNNISKWCKFCRITN